MTMKRLMTIAVVTALGLVTIHGQDAKPLYQNNFEQAAVDQVPDGFLVLDGGFVVREEGGNKFLELPGAPLDTFGVLFGPSEGINVAVSARIYSTGRGRRLPAFAIGLNGAGGFRLQVSAAKKVLELYRGEDVVGSAPYEWQSGSWTMLKLQLRESKAGEWKIEGKAWMQGATEPKDWSITHDDKNKPNTGRPSVWGNPFAGTPIRFDDLMLVVAK